MDQDSACTAGRDGKAYLDLLLAVKRDKLTSLLAYSEAEEKSTGQTHHGQMNRTSPWPKAIAEHLRTWTSSTSIVVTGTLAEAQGAVDGVNGLRLVREGKRCNIAQNRKAQPGSQALVMSGFK
jgi:hypothetical protein